MEAARASLQLHRPKPARNPNERNGDLASDGYHKYKEDVKLIKHLGLKAYRFSISWSRLVPDGRGAINQKGLQFYNNVINELVKEDELNAFVLV
ncbi:hypothetical protein ACP70R_035249 [Stipagrostis hirtigluma subsp. patula]